MKLKHLLLLLTTVVSFSATRAADDTTKVPADWTKVAFNPDFRYSQWVINSRLGDFYGNSTQVGFTQYDANGQRVGSEKTSKFDYVPGLVAKATLEARDLYKDFDWSKPWFYTVLNYGKNNTYNDIRKTKSVSLDNMNAAKMYFGLASDALGSDAKTLADSEIDAVIKDMQDYNKNYVIGVESFVNELGDDAVGGWFHKPGYVGQMWCDGLYMGPALLAQIINYQNGGTNPHIVTDETGSENDWDLIAKQFRISWKQVHNTSNNLLWHAFTANRDIAVKMCWEGVTADGTTYHSAAHWGRACGWYFLALVDVLEQMEKAGIQKTDKKYTDLQTMVQTLASGLAEYQHASGCWYQVLDEKDVPLAGNYLESSCTAIFAAAYLKGARLELFGENNNKYREIGEKAYQGCVEQFMMRDTDGNAQLIHNCASAGLGKECAADKLSTFDVDSYKKDNLRSGSREYYINGDTKKDVTQRNTYTEGKVLGAFILAATEYERDRMSYYLQPSYNIKAGETISANVHAPGNASVTYQWYKKTSSSAAKGNAVRRAAATDGTPISGATSAEYTPEESGTYYCVATSGSNSITTNETIVTVAEDGGTSDSGTVGGETETKLWFGCKTDMNKYQPTGNTDFFTFTTTLTIQNDSRDGYEKTVTIGGESYTVTNKTNSAKPEIRFTIPEGYKGHLYFVGGSSGSSNRTLRLTCPDNTTADRTVTGTTPNVVDWDALGAGYYSLTTVKDNYQIALLAMELTRQLNPTEKSDLAIREGTAYNYNSNTWTPSVGETISLDAIVSTSSGGAYSITAGDAATLGEDGKTLVAVKSGTVTLTQAPDATYKSGSVDIDVAMGTNIGKDGSDSFSFSKDAETVVSDGMTISRENITMTFGNDGFWAKATKDHYFTAGQKNPDVSDNIPTAGTYYKFRPTKSGKLAVKVKIGTQPGNGGKDVLRPLFVSENGTLITAKAGDYTVGNGEDNIEATASYIGDVEFNVKADTDYYIYIAGSKMNFYGFEFTPIASSDASATFSRGVLNGETLTVTHAESEANKEQTITVTPATGATCTSVTPPATLDGNTLRYKAPEAGSALNDINLTVTAENNTAKTYTIKVSTLGSMTTGNATFTLEELSGFGTLTGQSGTIKKQSVTLTDIKGPDGNVQGQSNGTGAKVQKTAGFTITPNQGYLITKVTLVTSKKNRRFDATPTQEGDVVQNDTTYEYSFNSIGDAITFKNNTTSGIYVYSIIVEYKKSVGSNMTILSASFDKDELTFYDNETIPALPALSIKIGDTEADKSLYTVKYTSSNAKVITVGETTGTLTKVGTGSAVINVEISPKDPNVYAGSEAYYTVNVLPLEEPVVSAHDLTVYSTAGVQPQPVIDVFTTDNGAPVRISNYYYALKFAEIEDNDDVINDNADGKFVLKGEPGNWKVGAPATVEVTVVPTEEAIQKFHIKQTSAKFTVTVVETGGLLIPHFGGVDDGKMQKSDLENERTFITPVLYDDVNISTGFTFDYSFVDAEGSKTVTAPAARLKNGTEKVTSITGSKNANVTIYSGNSEETVFIYVVAKPNNDYETQYVQIEKWIKVVVNDYKKFLEVSIEPAKQTVPVGTVLDQLDDFTVTVKDEDGKTLSYEDGEYTMRWQSSSPGVASVDRDATGGYVLGRKVRAISGGDADIKVIVSKDGYSDMGAVCTLTVEDKGMFKVDGGTQYKKGQPFHVDGLTLSLGGWMFSDMSKLDVSPWKAYGTTSEKPGVATKWGAPTTANKKPLGFTHNIQMTNMKNARQEYGSNCMPASRNIYDAKLVKQSFELMDPMFNVPCAGAYFALAPMTCGTATVYVRQNGVFEKDSKDEKTTYAYRPQRRVFVIDEHGNFVPSTPKLEYPTTWEMGTDGTVFRCDILNADVNGNVLTRDENTKDVSLYSLAGANPTKDANGEIPDTEKQKVRDYVQSHFIGLKNFSIQNFKNGVYANNVNVDSLQNVVAEKQLDATSSIEKLSARGWSVLSVAPVSYTFDVKPGKTYYIYNFGSKLGLYGFTFRKANVTVDEFNWSDTQGDIAPEPTAERHVAKVNIDRTFQAGVWAACVLPFSMTRQQVNAVFGDCYDNEHPEGTQILYFDRVEGSKIYFRRHAYNTLVAGKPFLIKPYKEAVISSANMGEYPYVTIEATTPQAEWGRTVGNTVGVGAVDTDYKWVSSYNSMTAYAGDHYIGKSGNVSYCTKTEGTAIKGFRGFLKHKGSSSSAKRLTVAYDDNIDGDDSATIIEGLVMDEEGNFIEVPTSGTIYNLSGQAVSNNADELFSLPAGIYIVNGKKYVVK